MIILAAHRVFKILPCCLRDLQADLLQFFLLFGLELHLSRLEYVVYMSLSNATLPVLRRMEMRFVSSSVSERDLCLTNGVDRRREDGEGVEIKIDTELCRVFSAIELIIIRYCTCPFFTEVSLLCDASECYDVDRRVFSSRAVARNTWN